MNHLRIIFPLVLSSSLWLLLCHSLTLMLENWATSTYGVSSLGCSETLRQQLKQFNEQLLVPAILAGLLISLFYFFLLHKCSDLLKQPRLLRILCWLVGAIILGVVLYFFSQIAGLMMLYHWLPVGELTTDACG
ncbi:hypothetical protein LPW36_11715 [Jinshanibacter sp. LJY008]|uniref:Uncharacterized protein n=1 Tax=Limnobaculum eriocheiris TaxID=2897391 RepID=A0A9X1MXD9_9GAMM|nr:hypothetical protein [Limnobaculum eriocheiris]MCD1126654.1 hypothetical protein [Limnobaculum eriocheiris]